MGATRAGDAGAKAPRKRPQASDSKAQFSATGSPRAASKTTSDAKKDGGTHSGAMRPPIERAGPGTAMDTGGSPASRRSLRNQGRRTMRKLLDAAMEAFDRRGYHATRVNDVVEIAKTSHGTFYLYFSNKEDLLRALVAEAAVEATELYRTLAETPAGGATWQDLRGWIGQYSSLWLRYAPLLRAWTDLAAVDPELGTQVRQAVTTMSEALAAQMVGAPGASTDIDPETAGMAVIALLDRFHFLREFLDEPIDDRALDTLTTMIYRALFGIER